jgi:hypothetical protein
MAREELGRSIACPHGDYSPPVDTEWFFWCFVAVALAPLALVALAQVEEGKWLLSVRDWLVGHPWGRWWWVPSGLLLPAEKLYVPPEPFAAWLSPIVLLLFGAVLTYGVYRRSYDSERSRVDLRNALKDQSDALEDQLDALADRILAEGSVRDLKAEQRDREAEQRLVRLFDLLLTQVRRPS